MDFTFQSETNHRFVFFISTKPIFCFIFLYDFSQKSLFTTKKVNILHSFWLESFSSGLGLSTS